MRNNNIAPGKVVHSGPTEGESCDLLVMESTYGNRVHPHEDPRPEMAALIRTTMQRGGSVVVPSFAVERTQKFLFLLKELMEIGQIPRVPVHADSPMAIKAVQVFLKHNEEFSDRDEGADREIRLAAGLAELPLRHHAARLQENQRVELSDHHRVVQRHGDGRPRAASPGAAPARSRNLVLFIGFQAPGTRGFTIKNGEPEVKMFGQVVPIRAQIAALEQFSDHADTPELLEWLHTFKSPPKQTFLVHGEPAAASQLRDTMIKDCAGMCRSRPTSRRCRWNS